MSGHSKWSKIKRKKMANDTKASKVMSKIIRELTIAARDGGDPNGNPRLRTAIALARSSNMSNDVIDRAVKRGSGEGEDAVEYEECVYEAYGPNGVALYIEVTTDNRNRTAAEVRYALSKNGGSLGAPNSVAWLFDKKGSVVVTRDGVDEDELMLVALDAGADDVDDSDDEYYEVVTAPETFDKVRTAVEEAEFPIDEAKLNYIPQTTVKVEERDAQTLFKLIEALEDLDDVANVYANFEMDDDVMDHLAETAA
ncbi:MAG: YebC/PmpR family DNA-binding transcriptional regulator [Candidatus Poribacteria bacterium]|nr:YebC/PmpR family DNA-binding transcriptional regulator [Candidatus Poribacteria bacterium]